jgi:predicted acetyltransferase
MTIELRRTKPDEFRAAADTFASALMFPRLSDDEWPEREVSWHESDTITAWDGDRCVGHAGAFRFETTVPGGNHLPTAGVTRVGVLPTHTRQGILRGLMSQLLTEVHANGTVLASLRASEAVIYGRFGFGIAGEAANVVVTRRTAGAVHRPAEGSIRILSRDELGTDVPELYERVGRRRVGAVSRPAFMWTRQLKDAIQGTKSSFVAVHEDSTGTADGYVHYDLAWREGEHGDPGTGRGEIHDLFGADADIERALWQYVLGIDLVDEWLADTRPMDEAVRLSLTNARSYRVVDRWDEQWVRLLDADVALGARSYRACDRSVAIQVVDPLISSNHGTWRIDSFGAFRSHQEPDLQVDIDALSAAYLGGTSWRELADAGRVRVRRADAVDEADTLFAQRPAPFSCTFF